MNPWLTSEPCAQVMSAFVAALRDVESVGAHREADVKSDKASYKYKYANLADVLVEVDRVCAAHDLAVTQVPGSEQGDVVVWTTILHKSGEWMTTAEPLRMKAGGTPQGAGSALTYARRYALTAVFKIAVEDDDAQKAEERVRETRQPRQQQQARQESRPARSDAPRDPIATEFGKLGPIGWKEATAAFRLRFGFSHMNVPPDRAQECLAWTVEEVAQRLLGEAGMVAADGHHGQG